MGGLLMERTSHFSLKSFKFKIRLSAQKIYATISLTFNLYLVNQMQLTIKAI